MWDNFTEVKQRDPYIFKKAEDVFADIDRTGGGVKQPYSIDYRLEDQLLTDGKPNPACSHGKVFRFNDNALLLIQFMRPEVWRIRFDAKNKAGSDFSDYNTYESFLQIPNYPLFESNCVVVLIEARRTIVDNTLTELIRKLDILQNVNWRVELVEDPQYFILQSVVDPERPTRRVVVQLWIQREPFKITAIRSIESLPPAEKLPTIQNLHRETMDQISLPASRGLQKAIIWQTKECGFQYDDRATILTVAKPVTANYMGFGEQGGKGLFKWGTYLNYFSNFITRPLVLVFHRTNKLT